jgi:hypothetical protein
VTGCSPHGGLGESVKSSLASIGLNVALWLRIGRPPRDPLNSRFEIECGKVQLAYPDPAAALNREIAEERLLDSRPDWLARLDRTARTSARARATAYERLERDLLRGPAPVAPYVQEQSLVLLAKGVGCYRSHPLYGTEYGALCLS